MKKLILVICRGNIQRSPIAERCIRQTLLKRGFSHKIIVTSRGIQGAFGIDKPEGNNLQDYPAEWRASKPMLDKLGIDLSDHIATPVDIDIIQKAKIIIIMDKKVLEILINKFPEHRHKTKLFMELAGKKEDIQDCAGLSDTNLHARIIELIYQVVEKNADVLSEWIDE
ncbi:MAG: hypothetical protein ABIJ91_01750 [Candidatus Kuenenbacteria bacterium]